MSVFIIQYMQTRAYIKRILRYSYWCKNAEKSFCDEESLLKMWNRNRLMKYSSAVTCFFFHCFRDAQLFQWCQYSFAKLGHWIIKLCIESLNTLKNKYNFMLQEYHVFCLPYWEMGICGYRYTWMIKYFPEREKYCITTLK